MQNAKILIILQIGKYNILFSWGEFLNISYIL